MDENSDDETPEPARRSKKPVPPGGFRSRKLSISLTEDQFTWLKKHAEKNRWSLSTAAVDVIEQVRQQGRS